MNLWVSYFSVFGCPALLSFSVCLFSPRVRNRFWSENLLCIAVRKRFCEGNERDFGEKMEILIFREEDPSSHFVIVYVFTLPVCFSYGDTPPPVCFLYVSPYFFVSFLLGRDKKRKEREREGKKE